MNDYKELIDKLRFYADTADDPIYGICINSPKVMFQAADAIVQLIKERNAVIADLKTVALNCHEDYTFSACFACEHNSTCNGQPSSGCEFEWRGVQEKRMTITEAERRYLSSDWCMTVSFAEYLHLLEQKGVEVSYERPT